MQLFITIYPVRRAWSPGKGKYERPGRQGRFTRREDINGGRWSAASTASHVVWVSTNLFCFSLLLSSDHVSPEALVHHINVKKVYQGRYEEELVDLTLPIHGDTRPRLTAKISSVVPSRTPPRSPSITHPPGLLGNSVRFLRMDDGYAKRPVTRAEGCLPTFSTTTAAGVARPVFYCVGSSGARPRGRSHICRQSTP